jgi:hypothetical protein
MTFYNLADGSFTRLTIPLAFSLALCNMDRIVLSIAMLPIAKEYGLSLAQQVRCFQDPTLFRNTVAMHLHLHCSQDYFYVAMQGIISSAFLWGYIGGFCCTFVLCNHPPQD